MIGAVNKFYPFRVYADKSISKMKNINYKKFNHPGYKFFKNKNNKLPIGKNYYSTMENSKIVVTCGTRLQLPIPKIWEIMSTGAILVMDKVKNRKKLNLVNNKNYVEANFNNICLKINYLIKNDALRKRIAKNAMIYSRKKYSLHAQADHLYHIINQIIKRKRLNVIKYSLSEIYLLKVKSVILNLYNLLKKIIFKLFNLNFLD